MAASNTCRFGRLPQTESAGPFGGGDVKRGLSFSPPFHLSHGIADTFAKIAENAILCRNGDEKRLKFASFVRISLEMAVSEVLTMSNVSGGNTLLRP